jgi:hypothetical protein
MFGVLAVIQTLVAEKYEISPTQTHCSVTYTVKIIKITAIVLTLIQNRKKLNHFSVSKKQKLVL